MLFLWLLFLQNPPLFRISPFVVPPFIFIVMLWWGHPIFASISQIKENVYVHRKQLLIYFDTLLTGKECGFSIKFLKLFKIISFKVGWFSHLLSYGIFKNRIYCKLLHLWNYIFNVIFWNLSLPSFPLPPSF